MDQGTHREVRDGSGAPRGSEIGRGTLGEVWDGSCYPRVGPGRDRDPLKGLGRIGGPSVISGTGRGSPEQVGRPSGGIVRVEGPSRTSWTSRGPLRTSETSRGTLPEVQDGLRGPSEAPGQVVRP